MNDDWIESALDPEGFEVRDIRLSVSFLDALARASEAERPRILLTQYCHAMRPEPEQLYSFEIKIESGTLIARLRIRRGELALYRALRDHEECPFTELSLTDREVTVYCPNCETSVSLNRKAFRKRSPTGEATDDATDTD